MAAQGMRGATRAKKRFTTKADPAAPPGPGSREARLHRHPARCPVGGGLHLLLDVVGHRLRRLRHRRVLPSPRRLEGGPLHDRTPSSSTPSTWRPGPAGTPAWTASSATPTPARQYTSIAYTERLGDVGAAPSIGTVGDSYDNAMAESVMGLFKTELHRNPAALAANGGPWKGLDDLEIATCAWVSWFNEERLHSELDDQTPAEVEADYRHKSQPNAA